MADYESLTDLAEHIDMKGGPGYFFQNYTTADDITIAGVGLPPGIIEAATRVAADLDLLEKWLPEV